MDRDDDGDLSFREFGTGWTLANAVDGQPRKSDESLEHTMVKLGGDMTTRTISREAFVASCVEKFLSLPAFGPPVHGKSRIVLMEVRILTLPVLSLSLSLPPSLSLSLSLSLEI